MKLFTKIKDISPELNKFGETLFLCNNNGEMKILISILKDRYGYSCSYDDTTIQKYNNRIITLNRIMKTRSVSEKSIYPHNTIKLEDIVRDTKCVY